MGYNALIYYKDQLWLDHMQPDAPCQDLKKYDIIKGGTYQSVLLHENSGSSVY